MPKGKKRSMLEERAWLAAYEAGKGIEEIAKGAHRASSTVWRGIEKARRERETRVIREGLLREAYQGHFEDLLEVARRVQKAAAVPDKDGLLFEVRLAPTPEKSQEAAATFDKDYRPPPIDRRTQMLVAGLKEHIPDSRLWRAWKEWEDRAKRMDAVAVETKARLAEAVDRTFAAAGTGVSRDGLIESLWFAITQTAKGESLDHMEYRIERTVEGPSLRWGAYGLSAVGADETVLKALQDHHRKLIQEVAASEECVGNVRDAHRRWGKARDDIDQEIEILLLRRLLPGQCNLCPQ